MRTIYESKASSLSKSVGYTFAPLIMSAGRLDSRRVADTVLARNENHSNRCDPRYSLCIMAGATPHHLAAQAALVAKISWANLRVSTISSRER